MFLEFSKHFEKIANFGVPAWAVEGVWVVIG